MLSDNQKEMHFKIHFVVLCSSISKLSVYITGVLFSGREGAISTIWSEMDEFFEQLLILW